MSKTLLKALKRSILEMDGLRQSIRNLDNKNKLLIWMPKWYQTLEVNQKQKRRKRK